jgi:D-arginine dehydrogenase
MQSRRQSEVFPIGNIFANATKLWFNCRALTLWNVFMHDVIIIGGGIAGASAAYSLVGSHRVVLLEAEAHCGSHTTGRSAALFAQGYGNATIRALTRASRSFYLAPPSGFASVPLLSPRGSLVIATRGQEDRLDALFEETAPDCAQATIRIGAARARQMVPSLRDDYVTDAFVDHSAMDIDVDALFQGFLRGAREKGAQIIVRAPVYRLGRQAGFWRAETPQGAFEAPVVVNSAGAWADEVAARAGSRPLGLVPKRRTALLVSPPDGVEVRSWPAVIDVDEKFYFKPSSGMLLLSPADETPTLPGDAQPEEMDIAIAVDRVQQAADIPVRRVSRSWAGLRSFFPDKTPALGWSIEERGFLWLAGQGGYGIQTAPAMGRLAASFVKAEPPPQDMLDEGLAVDALSPSRPELVASS